MIIQGPQNVYNSMASLDGQNLTSRPEITRNQGTASAPRLVEEKLASEKQAESAPRSSTDVSLQQVKNLSEIFNTYQSYVNQVDAENSIIGRVSQGVVGMPDVLAIA